MLTISPEKIWIFDRTAISEFGLCLIAFGACFPCTVATWIVSFGCFFCLVSSFGFYFDNIRKSVSDRRLIPAYLLLALCLLSFVSAAYADRPGYVFSKMFATKLTWFGFPLLAIVCRPSCNLDRILKSYFLGVVVFVVYSFCDVACGIRSCVNMSVFIEDGMNGLTTAFNYILNRAFAGTCIFVSVLFFFHICAKGSLMKQQLIFCLTSLLIFCLYEYLHSSRAVSFCGLFVLLISVFVFFHERKKIVLCLLGALLALTSVVLLTDNRISKSAKMVCSNGISGLLTQPEMDGKNEEPRAEIWNSVANINHHSFWRGYGEAHSTQYLIEDYKKKGFELGVGKQFHTHNVFLKTYLELGGIGVILLLAVMLSAPIFADSDRRKLIALAMLLLAMVDMTDIYICGCTSGAITFSMIAALLPSMSERDRVTKFNQLTEKSVCLTVTALSAVLVLVSFLLIRKEMAKDLFISSKVDSSQHESGYVYRMGKRSFKTFFNGDAYASNILVISKNKERQRSVSMDCLVSDEFNGDDVYVVCWDRGVAGKAIAHYDMNRKGVWQTLNLDMPAGYNQIELYIRKNNSFDLKKLSGCAEIRNLVVN